MSITLLTLSRKMKDYPCEFVFNHHVDAKIYNFAILQNHQTWYEKGCLYVGKISQLSKLPQQTEIINLLCVVDKDHLPEHITQENWNLLLVYTTDNFETVLEKVSNIFASLHKHLDFSIELLTALTRKAGLQEIFDLGFKYINNPMLLNDTSFRLIAYRSDWEINDPFWNGFISDGYLSPDIVSDFKKNRLYERVLKSRTPILGQWSKGKYPRMISSIIIGNKIIGHLCIFAFNAEFQDEDFELARLLSESISTVMEKEQPFGNAKQTMYEFFIHDILDGKLTDHEMISDRSLLLDFNLKDQLFVLSVNTLDIDPNKISVSSICSMLEELTQGGKSIVYKNFIVTIFSRPKDSALQQSEIDNFETFLSSIPVHAGLSRNFKHLRSLQKYFRQSVKAIEIGKSMNSVKSITLYDEIAIYHLFYKYSTEELLAFCSPYLIKLIKYDRKHNSSYTETLYSYIVMAREKVASANSLHVHRNTMSYRMSKIWEIIDVNPENFEHILSLYISYKILEYTGDLIFDNGRYQLAPENTALKDRV